MSDFKSWFPNIYFETEKGVLINDDCFNVFKYIPDKSIDMILTDLPYGTTACKWDGVLPLDRLWAEYKRITKDNSVIALFGNEPFTSKLICSNLQDFKYRIDWDKKIPSGMNYAKYRPMQQVEDIIIFSNGGGKTRIYNPQMIKRDVPIKGGGMKNSDSASTKGYKALKKVYEYKYPTTLIQFDKVRKGSLHPTQKPVALLEYLIKTYTNEGDLVLDNTAGVATTGVAAENTNRRWICIEKEKEYCDKAVTRFSK